MREAEQKDLTVADILSQSRIEGLSPKILDSSIEFLNDHLTPLTVEKVLREPPKELLHTALRIIEQGEELLTEKKGSRRRSNREIKEIRSQAESRKGRLLSEGPGKILASIAANPGRKAKWSTSGLIGVEEEWQEPTKTEIGWWKWFYDQFHAKEKLPDLDEINILHAAFVVRFRREESDIWEFMKRIEPYLEMDGELEGYLAKITKCFSQTSKRR